MMWQLAPRTRSLLSPNDPEPVELINADSAHPVLLVCEHAGQVVPEWLDDLGLPAGALDDHNGWDIGARAVTLRIAENLGAPAVLQRYSRLLIDCNRPPEAPDSIPEISHGTPVPANRNLTGAQRQARVAEVFQPFHLATTALLDHPGRRAAFAIHSFTPVLAGVARPWDIGFLFRHDTETSHRLSGAVARIRPELNIGMNQPYQIEDASDWFVPRHGEAMGVAHSLVEIRNDYLRDAAGQTAWADLLSSAIITFLESQPK